MKKLIIIFLLSASGLFGQDNPMFDSLDYFTRNKIKTIHYHISNWYYSPNWDYMKWSFDKKTNTLNCDSIHFEDPSSAMAKMQASMVQDFNLKDTVYHRPGFAYSSTIKYQFDKKGRLAKMLDVTAFDPESKVPGLSAKDREYTTTKDYFYSDPTSKNIKQIITESPYYREERNFFYDKGRLIKRVNTKTEKGDKSVSVETFLYEYYADGKLRKETRQVADSQCKSNCEGTIEYTYETD